MTGEDAHPRFTDSHCHLADPKLRDEVGAVLARSRSAGIARIVSIGAIGSIETDRLTVKIAEAYAEVYAAVGVHPHDAKDCDGERIGQLRDLAGSRKVVAIGESGLDFHYMHSTKEAQESALLRHLELAKELDLPISIHCRAAERRLVELVSREGLPPAGGVIHCFTGDLEAANDLLGLGFYISFSGIVTFKNAGDLRAVAGTVPSDRILVETDAPYLSPEPNRGKRNEPAFAVLTLEVLARARGQAAAALAATIEANTTRLFRLPVATA